MHHDFHDTDWEAFDDLPSADDLYVAERNRRKQENPSFRVGERRKRTRLNRPPRSEADQAFKCGHCRQFIGAPISGGRHRNHCPNCLYSRHVDDSHPGDRRSDCHAMMEPIGLLARRNGEQVILHLCLRCGKEDPNRIAADDNPVLLMHLQPVQPAGLTLVPVPEPASAEEESA